MRTTENRIEAYDAKVDPTHYQALMTVIAPLARGNFAAYANNYEALESAALQVLDLEGVSRLQYGGYLAFFNRALRMKAAGGGSTWLIAVLVIMNEWVARGLTQSVLEAMATTVLGWSHPTGW